MVFPDGLVDLTLLTSRGSDETLRSEAYAENSILSALSDQPQFVKDGIAPITLLTDMCTAAHRLRPQVRQVAAPIRRLARTPTVLAKVAVLGDGRSRFGPPSDTANCTSASGLAQNGSTRMSVHTPAELMTGVVQSRSGRHK